VKYWLRYSKSGPMRFVGHLDMLQTWERVLRRARVPLAFSQGFSPRPVLSLAAPLPVGLSSSAEYLELETSEEVPDLAELVAIALPQGMEASGAAIVPPGVKALMGLVRYGDYVVENFSPEQLTQLEQQLPKFLGEEVVLQEVRRKGGTRSVNIRPLVAAAQLDDGVLRLRLALGSVANLRVEDLLTYFSLPVAPLHINRQEIYLEKNKALVTPFEYISR
jgi:radical SAM-linked protein